MKATSSKPKTDDVPTSTVNNTKTGTKVFAATSSNQDTIGTNPTSGKRCVARKESHPLWRSPVFCRKTPTERTKLAAENKLCFSCLNEGHAFRQCPQQRKCTKESCSSSHNTLLHGSERIFPNKASSAENKDNKVTTGKSTKVSQKSTGSKSSGMPSVSDVKSLLQITEIELESPSGSEKVLVLCDSACSHSWISKGLADKLQIKGSPTKLATQNDTILKKARDYIDECPSVDGASQLSTKATSKNMQPSETSSAKTSRQSRTSS